MKSIKDKVITQFHNAILVYNQHPGSSKSWSPELTKGLVQILLLLNNGHSKGAGESEETALQYLASLPEEAKEWFSTGTNELGGSLLERVKNALKDQAKEKAGNEIKDIIKEAVYKAIKSKN